MTALPNTSNRLPVRIAAFALAGIAVHLLLRIGFPAIGAAAGMPIADIPLLFVLALGGIPLLWGLATKMLRRQFGADLLAGISIVTSVLLHEYLAGALVVLMLSGGEALEAFATRSASNVLGALAKRMPRLAQRKTGETVTEVSLDTILPGDLLVVFPHALCPVDGTVV